MKIERTDYSKDQLLESDVAADPFEQFTKWFNRARDCAEIVEASAMTLATASAAGLPSARIVLLRNVDTGFVFYTNYLSHKGAQLAENPLAALVFHWAPLERQVRITGSVSKVSSEDSDNYFASRPHKSRLGALVSQQSTPIASADALRQQLDMLESEYPAGSAVPRPANWGGYRVTPNSFELWQGRRSRLHDRLLYTFTNDRWQLSRLAP